MKDSRNINSAADSRSSSKVLKASAGTGKTYRLSLEYLAALLQGQDFREIAVLTFTRKATAEARERIFEHLIELETGGRDTALWWQLKQLHSEISWQPEKLRSCREEMLLEKDSIHVYTIDSFTNQLFQSLVAPALGIYDYQITETGDNQEVVDAVLTRLLQQESAFEKLENLLGIKVRRDLKSARNYLEKIIADRWKFLFLDEIEQRQPLETSALLRPLDRCLELLGQVAAARGEELTQDWVNKDYQDNIWNYYQRICQGEDRQESRELLLKHWKTLLKQKTFWNSRRVPSADSAEITEIELEEFYQEFQQQLARRIFNREVLPLEKAVLELGELVVAEYDRLTFKQRRFTYSDISNYVYKYLVSEESGLTGADRQTGLGGILSRLAGTEIKSLFIDEFQDTSVLQWKILEKFLREERNFIAVGDAKQSIYQWRGGEQELFVRLPEMIAAETENLYVCYRSDREIMNFVNDFFCDLHPGWDYQEVEPAPDAGRGYFEVLLGGSAARLNENTKTFQNYSDDKQEEIRQHNRQIVSDLPQAIARRISVDFPDYQDVAVIARRNRELKQVADCLAEEEIPYILPAQGNLLENKAVWPLYQLLQYFWLNDFHYLANFLRSEMVNLPQEQLKFILKYRPQLQERLQLARRRPVDFTADSLLIDHPDLAEVLDWVGSLARAEYQELTRRLIRESGSFFCWEKDRAAVKNLYRFYTLLREKNSLDELLEFCREEKSAAELQETRVEGENAVELLTVHKAKGLSLDTLFFYWSPSAGGGGGREEELRIFLDFASDYSRVDSYLISSSRYDRLLDWLDLSFSREEEKHQELMEEINNVYVALTRASHNLFLLIESPVQVKPEDEHVWLKKSDSYNFYEPNLLEACRIEQMQELLAGIQHGKFQPPDPAESISHQELEDLSPYFEPGLKDSAERKAIAAREKDIDFDLKQKTSRTLGQAVHYYLENITAGSPGEQEMAEKLVKTRYGNILGKSLVQQAVCRAREVIANHPGYFSDHWLVLNEYRPALLEEGEEGARIDRLLVDHEKQEIVILDFKTGAIVEEDQLERYRQLIAREAGSDYDIQVEFISL